MELVKFSGVLIAADDPERLAEAGRHAAAALLDIADGGGAMEQAIVLIRFSIGRDNRKRASRPHGAAPDFWIQIGDAVHVPPM